MANNERSASASALAFDLVMLMWYKPAVEPISLNGGGAWMPLHPQTAGQHAAPQGTVPQGAVRHQLLHILKLTHAKGGHTLNPEGASEANLSGLALGVAGQQP